MDTTFKDYQLKHEQPYTTKYLSFKSHVHEVLSSLLQKIETPELLMKISCLGIKILLCHSSLKPILRTPYQWTKDIKNFTNFLKGWRSIDGFLNSPYSIRMVILNVSSFTLLIISSLSLGERFNIFDISTIKTRLSVIPVFGVLAYGGLFPIASLGLFSMFLLKEIDKSGELDKISDRIKNKIDFWNIPLDQVKIQARQNRYQEKIEKWQEELNVYQQIRQEGIKVRKNFKKNPIKNVDKLLACQQAIEDLNEKIKENQRVIKQYKERQTQWAALERCFSWIDPQELKEFQTAKVNKWKLKLDKSDQEKNLVTLRIAINIMRISSQILIVGITLSGCGTVVLPGLLGGLELLEASFGIKAYLDKQKIHQMKILNINPLASLIVD